MQRVLLTGVTGFVGSHLARRLVGTGSEVHAVVRTGARLDRVSDLRDRVVLHVDDGSADALVRAVEAAAPEVTFHLATNFVAEHRSEDIPALVNDNVAFPTRLADALAGAAVRPFVNVGTAWQHVEGADYRPKNLYAASKQAFEDVLRYYADTGRLTPVTLTLYDTYGPLDHRGKLVQALLQAGRDGRVLEMSSGTQLIDLVHVDDVVDALVAVADLPAAPPRAVPAYSASSGEPRTLRELVELVGTVVGRPLAVRWGARPDREREMLTPWDAGPRIPGWAPRISLEEGLGRLLDDGSVSG